MTTHRTKLAVLTGLILTGLALVTMAVPASAQGYPGGGTISLTSAEASPGSTNTVSCSGFMPGTPVEVYLRSDPILLGTLIADENGTISFDATIPENAPLGTHTLECTGTGQDGNALTLSADFTVVAAPVPGTPPATTVTGTLPRTGSDSTNLLRVGLVLVVAGTAIAVVVRRRNRDSVSA